MRRDEAFMVATAGCRIMTDILLDARTSATIPQHSRRMIGNLPAFPHFRKRMPAEPSPISAAPPVWSADAHLSPAPRRSRPVWFGLAAFLAVFVALQSLYGLAGGSAAEKWIVETATVMPAAGAVALLHPGWQARADGPRLVVGGKRINVRYGCEGTEVVFLLVAAMLATRAGWRWRLAGLLTGIGVVWLLNQMRLVALVHVLMLRREWFASVHGAIAPLLVVTLTALFFLAWLRRVPADATA
jgi:exosortase/archaeosortase family protein